MASRLGKLTKARNAVSHPDGQKLLFDIGQLQRKEAKAKETAKASDGDNEKVVRGVVDKVGPDSECSKEMDVAMRNLEKLGLEIGLGSFGYDMAVKADGYEKVVPNDQVSADKAAECAMELKVAMRTMIEPKIEEDQKTITGGEDDGSGTIGYEEVLKLMTLRLLSRDPKKDFRLSHDDVTGKIPLKFLQRAAMKLREHMTDEERQEVQKQLFY